MFSNNKRSTIAAVLSLAVLLSSSPFPSQNLSVQAQEQVKIFPSLFEGEWQNAEAAFVIDLPETAELADFTQENSAYLPEQKVPAPLEESAEQLAEPEQTGESAEEPAEEETPPPGEPPSEEPILEEPSLEDPAPESLGVLSGEEPALAENLDSLSFSGFSVGEELAGKELENAKLGLSTAGNLAEGETLLVEYALADNTWRTLLEFQGPSEFSNAANQRYFFSDLQGASSEDVGDLRLRLSFSGVEGLVYLDALWLEMQIKAEAKESAPQLKPSQQTFQMTREKKLSPANLERSWKADEEPEFALNEIARPKNNLLAQASALFLQTETKVSAVLIDPEGLEREEGVVIENNKVKVKKPKERSFTPGIYTLRIRVKEGNSETTQEQEFAWGVLAINTNKSLYLPGERAYLQMGVLDDRGHTICDAGLLLKIQSPKSAITVLSTDAGTIQYSGECGPDNVVDVPDYFAYYQIPNEVGAYQMELTAATKNGERSIADQFEARVSVPFDVERTGPTRIYPLANYAMEFYIKANEDFAGQVKEYVPSSFEVPFQQTGINFQTRTLSNASGAKEISWQVDWKAGEAYNLSYEFDAPDVSPEFYLLGPLEIGSFKEARQWQIASDSTAGPQLPQNCPTNCESVTGIGTVAWTNPENVSTSDTNRAVAALGKSEVSNWLKITNFGFSLTSSDIVQGITVEWEISEGGAAAAGGVTDNAVRIVQGGTIGSSDFGRGSSTFWPAPASEAYVSFGGVSELWGETWDYTDINATTFGAAISAINTKVSGGGAAENARVNSVRITVTYDAPNLEQYNWRWRNDNAGEGGSATLYFNPTGNGFGSVDFTIVGGACAGGSEWDCVDDGSTDTQASVPTSDTESSELTLANAKDYYTLVDDGIAAGATITQLDITVAGADDIGNPNTSVTLGYCIVGGANECGTNDTMGSSQNITGADQTKTEQFTSLSLSTTDLNNMQLVVQGSGTNATISTLYVLVSYDTSPASYKAAENTAITGQQKSQNVRLRFTIDNNGVSAASNFRLQVSSMVGTCDDAGSGESYVNVPTTTAGCGSDVACLTLTDNFGNQADTFDLADANGLTDPVGSGFVTGRLVEDPGNTSESQTTSITLAQNEFTEIEFNFQFTSNAADETAYCFRPTRSGTILTTYTGASASNATAQITTAAAGGAPTLTFSIPDVTIGFGTLSTGAARWATGTESGSSTSIFAHIISVSTNATNGYTITMNGTTLTSGSDTIDAIGASAVDVTDPGSVGTEQFGVRFSTGQGTITVSSPYNGATNFHAFDTAAFPDVIATGPGDEASNVLNAYYAANIATTTEAHTDYTSNLTYIATGNF